MLIEPKRNNAAVFRISDRETYVVVAEEFNTPPTFINELTTIPGTCYGMDIYTSDGKRQYYATQSRVVSAKMEDNHLIVYEEGKSLPWKFSRNGIAVNRARFDENNKDDIKYVKDKYGLSKKDIPYLNDYEAYVEYILEIEPKLHLPITIDLRDEKNKERYIGADGKYNVPIGLIDASIFVDTEKLPLSNGVMLDTDNPKYGFKVISIRDSKEYATQCPLIGVQVIDGLVHVYEDGKTTPWRFTPEGELLEYAKFFESSRRDIRYIKDNFCLSSEDVPNINSYGLKYVNKD